MLKRKMYDELLEWKSRNGHKSLLIRGQRQTGKTYIVEEFAKSYNNSVTITLDKNAQMRKAFRDASSVDDIIKQLEARDPRFDAVEGDTLIFLDEIQSCPAARSFLKEFTIDGRYDVIASGSLLDVPIRVEKSKRDYEEDAVSTIPVGYEEHLRMYPLDFEEFLWAKGYRQEVIDRIRTSIRKKEPLRSAVVESMNSLFREHMMVGGMPEAVSNYISNGIPAVRNALDSVILSMNDDVAKYTSASDALKIRQCFDSIPAQLSETNKKFMYSRLETRGSREGARNYSDALLWIGGCGIGNPCYKLRSIDKPLSMSHDPDNFKMYLSDTGTLIHMMDRESRSDSPAMRAVAEKDMSYKQGALTENMVAECLMKAGIARYHFINRKEPGRMELDFVIELGPDIVAIEDKSGKSRTAPSLSKTLSDSRFDRRMKFENTDIHVDDNGIEHYPIFAAAFIDDMKRKDDGWMERFEGRTCPDLEGLLDRRDGTEEKNEAAVRRRRPQECFSSRSTASARTWGPRRSRSRGTWRGAWRRPLRSSRRRRAFRPAW